MCLIARTYSSPTRNADELGLEHRAGDCRPCVATDAGVQVTGAYIGDVGTDAAYGESPECAGRSIERGDEEA